MFTINGSAAGATAAAAEAVLIHAETTAIAADSTLIKSALYARTGAHPLLAAAIDVTPSATAWKLGLAAAIVATGGIATAFQITGVNVEKMGTTSGDMVLNLYEGTAATTAVASVRFTGSTAIGLAAAGVNGIHIPVISKSIVANKSIYAKCAALTTTVPVPAISINYKVV